MASSVLEQILENVRAGAILPLVEEPAPPNEPCLRETLGNAARSILSRIDVELARLHAGLSGLYRIGADGTPETRVRILELLAVAREEMSLAAPTRGNARRAAPDPRGETRAPPAETSGGFAAAYLNDDASFLEELRGMKLALDHGPDPAPVEPASGTLTQQILARLDALAGQSSGGATKETPPPAATTVTAEEMGISRSNIIRDVENYVDNVLRT